MKTDELKKELAQVIQYQTRLKNELAGSDNERNRVEHDRLVESTAAFQAVLDRLNGGPSLTLYY
jgi:hypothetical protein